MCELLGICSNLFTNIEYSSQFMSEHSAKHKNGWGVAFYPPLTYNSEISSKQCKLFKEEITMGNSDLLKYLNENKVIKSKIILNHIRYSTSTQNYDNTHPFVRELFGQNWSFIHNGATGLDNYFKSYLGQNNNKIDFIPIGLTGSDKAFCIILNELKKNIQCDISTKDIESNLEVICKYDFEKAQKIIYQTCKNIMNSGANINIILSNGEYLITFFSGYNKLHYLYRKGTNVNPSNNSYFQSLGLIKSPNEKAVIIATEKLTSEDWKSFKKGEMLIFKDGELVYKNGEKVNNENTKSVNEVSDIEVYDSSAQLDRIDIEKKVIGVSQYLRDLLNLKIGDEVKVINKTKEINLKVYDSDENLSENGLSKADNPDKYVCIPRVIRNYLELNEINSTHRANLPKFKKKFSSVDIKSL